MINKPSRSVASISCISFFIFVLTGTVYSGSTFKAYYVSKDGKKYSSTATLAMTDIIVEIPKQKGILCFKKYSGFFPEWKTVVGKWMIDPLENSTDFFAVYPVNEIVSMARIIKSSEKEILIHCRYAKSSIDVIEDYYLITSDGEVVRSNKRSEEKIASWLDSNNIIRQEMTLTEKGIKEAKIHFPELKSNFSKVKGSRMVLDTIIEPKMWWKFDEARGDMTLEAINRYQAHILGHKSVWRKGLSLTSLQFDGRSTQVIMPAAKVPVFTTEFSVEGCFAMASYPSSLIPIIQQVDEQAGIHNSKIEKRGFFLGVNDSGQPAFGCNIEGNWEQLIGDEAIPLRQWAHLAGTFNASKGLMVLYLDGKTIKQKSVSQSQIFMSGDNLKIGHAGRRYVRKQGLSSVTGHVLDGLIDAIRLYDKTLTPKQVKISYKSFRGARDQINNPDIETRKKPLVPTDDKFSASYTRLHYFEGWDNQFRLGTHSDIVINFKNSNNRIVFWHGRSYRPFFVDGSNEWWDRAMKFIKINETSLVSDDCHIDSQLGNVRIVEQTESRIVIQAIMPKTLYPLGEKTWGESFRQSKFVRINYVISQNETVERISHLYQNGT